MRRLGGVWRLLSRNQHQNPEGSGERGRQGAATWIALGQTEVCVWTLPRLYRVVLDKLLDLPKSPCPRSGRRSHCDYTELPDTLPSK